VNRSWLFLVFGVGVLLGCGKSLEEQTRDQVRILGGAEFEQEAVEVLSIDESGNYALAEISVKTAVKLKKEGGRWEIDEVRLGDRRWESMDRILRALEANRQADTAKQMGQIRVGINRYVEKHGSLPEASDFGALIDLLCPGYVQKVTRLDAWSNGFLYRRKSDSTLELRSAGPDGKFDTADDLVMIR
jgi:hypothetical protein